MSDWQSANERKTRSERFSEIMKSDISSLREDVAGAFAAESGQIFILADIALELLMKPVGRVILTSLSLFFLWLLL